MILGIGSDLIDIDRIADTIERFGDRFIHRIYTPVEIARAERRADRVATYAKRFAAKEACAKARLDAITPSGLVARIDLTISDEYPLAQALVIISAEAPGFPA